MAARSPPRPSATPPCCVRLQPAAARRAWARAASHARSGSRARAPRPVSSACWRSPRARKYLPRMEARAAGLLPVHGGAPLAQNVQRPRYTSTTESDPWQDEGGCARSAEWGVPGLPRRHHPGFYEGHGKLFNRRAQSRQNIRHDDRHGHGHATSECPSGLGGEQGKRDSGTHDHQISECSLAFGLSGRTWPRRCSSSGPGAQTRRGARRSSGPRGAATPPASGPRPRSRGRSRAGRPWRRGAGTSARAGPAAARAPPRHTSGRSWKKRGASTAESGPQEAERLRSAGRSTEACTSDRQRPCKSALSHLRHEKLS